MGFALQVELVSNGGVGEHWCFGKFQSLLDCRYGFYTGIMIPNYRGVCLVVIVGRVTSCAEFWFGCWWCQLGSVTKSNTQLIHLVGQLLELFLQKIKFLEVLVNNQEAKGGKQGYCVILGQVLIVINGNCISIIDISGYGMDVDSCAGINRVSSVVIIVFVGIVVSGGGIAIAGRLS